MVMQSPLRSSSSGGSSEEGIMALPRSPQHMKHNPAAVIPVGGGVEESSSCESEPKSSLMVPLVAATGGDPTVVEALAPPSWLLRSRKLSRDRPLSSSTATDKTSMTKSKRGISLGLLKRICFCGNASSSSSSSSNISSSTSNISGGTSGSSKCKCKYPRNIVQSTLSFMHFLGRVLMWSSVAATAAGVVWYSRELSVNGTDPHLIAWFSAGAFVLLGFPISMYGIFMHLSNYYQPNVQCYVVRILWMVPLYSIESWLCLRFHKYAIYIETLRDCYESYVLYSFLRFLMEVLGGEEALVLMLKDKSPTRGVHMWGFEWCIKPWLMGQPMSRTIYIPTNTNMNMNAPPTTTTPPTTTGSSTTAPTANVMGNDPTPGVIVLAGPGANSASTTKTTTTRPVKRVQWTSPFFVKCKLGVLQYVLLKVVLSILTMILETHDLYKEGNFTPKGGYLYICILTNLSQCWALYCLIFFYYATKNELGPIRPVGKFLCVKAIVFFTWWQSVGISILYQMGMIPHYASNSEVDNEWSSEDVAKGLQDYLICIEMFIGAIVHTFVFPHTDYLNPIGNNNNHNRPPRRHHNHTHNDCNNNNSNDGTAARHFGGHQSPDRHSREGRRLGRKGRAWNAALSHQYQRVNVNSNTDDKSHASKNSSTETPEYDLELGPLGAVMVSGTTTSTFPSVDSERELALIPLAEHADETDHRMIRSSHAESTSTSGTHSGVEQQQQQQHYHHHQQQQHSPQQSPQQQPRPTAGFVRALLDSSIPSDVVGHTMGMVKGDFAIEKKTLLFHAATSDEYDLFSKYHQHHSRSRGATPAASTSINTTATTAGGAATRSTVAASSMPTSTPLLPASSTHKQPPTKTPKEQH